MKVILVSPPNIYFKKSGISHLVEPLGIAYIAAVLEKKGYDIDIIDADTLNLSVDCVVSLLDERNPDVVGFTCLTPLIDVALDIAKRLKEKRDVITVFGGTHPTCSYNEVMANHCVDYVVVGEGEDVFPELLEAVASKSPKRDIKGICYRDPDSNQTVFTGSGRRLAELDALPFPARHLLPMDRYTYSFPIVPRRAARPRYASLNFSRGCVYNCVFCSSPAQWGKKVYYRSGKNIVEELKQIVADFGINIFYVRDEIFTINKANVIDICEEIVNSGLDLQWFCYARADHLDKNILTHMKKAGCSLVKIGVESGDEEILKKIKKGETKETIRRAFKLAEEVGLYTHASFMIGHPWDTPKTIQKTIDFAKEINADTAGFPITTPFPGTELWEMAKSNALLMTEDFRKYGPWFSPVMRTFSIEAKDLVRYEKKALVSYYFRWNYILKALKRILKYPPSWRAYVDPFKILLDWIL